MSEREQQRPFLIKGADRKTVSIPPGEYYFNTKARIRRQMQNSLSPEGRRVYACLELATMGFQQEKAVTMKGGKIRALTRADISEETGLSPQHVRRAIVELEEAGLAERRGMEDGPLHKGKVELFSWAVPRAPKTQNGSQRAAPIPEWFPEDWQPLKTLISRLKLTISIDEGAARDYLEEGRAIADDFRESEAAARQFLEKICGPKNSLAAPEDQGAPGNGGSAPPFEMGAGAPPQGASAQRHGVSAPEDGVSALQDGVSAPPKNGRIREITERTERTIERTTPPDERTVTTPGAPEPTEEPSVRPVGGWSEKPFRKRQLAGYLTRTFRYPTAPDDVVLEPLADLVSNEREFQQFQEACKGFLPTKGWKGFLAIAERCAENREAYQQADSPDPARTPVRTDPRAAAFAREMEAKAAAKKAKGVDV